MVGSISGWLAVARMGVALTSLTMRYTRPAYLFLRTTKAADGNVVLLVAEVILGQSKDMGRLCGNDRCPGTGVALKIPNQPNQPCEDEPTPMDDLQ
eukprot:COSAG06_NODE_6190_length_3057_cov_2.188641_2_plen_96_part_00